MNSTRIIPISSSNPKPAILFPPFYARDSIRLCEWVWTSVGRLPFLLESPIICTNKTARNPLAGEPRVSISTLYDSHAHAITTFRVTANRMFVYTRSTFTTSRFIAPINRGCVHEGDTKIVYIPSRFPPHKSVIMPLPITAVSFLRVPRISKAARNAFFFGLPASNKAGISLISPFPRVGGLLFETITSFIA